MFSISEGAASPHEAAVPPAYAETHLRLLANGVEHQVCVTDNLDGEPLLLIPGMGMQLIDWPREMVDGLVAEGFRVIRYDPRDIGLSESMDRLGKANIMGIAVGSMFGVRSRPPYSLSELAEDASALLRELGVASAHVCGMSMGGMVAQRLAIHHRNQVRSLTLMMTSSGSPWLPRPNPLLMHRLSKRPPSRRDMDALAKHVMEMHHALASPKYPEDKAVTLARLRISLQRSYRPHAAMRQAAAVMSDGDRTAILHKIQAPTLVIHGKADPLVPHAAGQDLAKRIHGARLDEIDGMGHDLPVPLCPRFVAQISAIAQVWRLRQTAHTHTEPA